MTDPKPKAMSVEEAIHTLGLYLAGDELKHKARAALAVLRGLAKENAALKERYLVATDNLAAAKDEICELRAELACCVENIELAGERENWDSNASDGKSWKWAIFYSAYRASREV